MSAEVWSKAGQWLSFLLRRDCLLVSQQKLFLQQHSPGCHCCLGKYVKHYNKQRPGTEVVAANIAWTIKLKQQNRVTLWLELREMHPETWKQEQGAKKREKSRRLVYPEVLVWNWRPYTGSKQQSSWIKVKWRAVMYWRSTCILNAI